MFAKRLLPVFINLLICSTIISSAFAQGFTLDTQSTEGLSGVDFGSAKWGDYDSDGDLDMLLSGRNVEGDPSTLIYANDNGIFTNVETSLTGVSSSSAAWGDYDNDGDLDIVISGKDASNQLVTRIFRNGLADGAAAFTSLSQEFAGLQAGSVEWGDYDNDGDLDVLLTGNNRFNRTESYIYRNDLDMDTGERQFVDTSADIGSVFLGNATWGDYDNDGDLDILMTGSSSSEGLITRIYENNNGAFEDINASLMAAQLSYTTWGDYDNDGDLDILISGKNGAGVRKSMVYRNDNGVFSDIGALLVGAESGAAEWGDCDNDGDLDVIITGLSPDGIPFTTVFDNDNGEFSEGIEFTGVTDGSAAWGDYDNDGDLDLLIAGKDATQNVRQILLYRNDIPVHNLPPSSPDGLSATYADQSFLLEWNPAFDNETPVEGLTYNVRVQTAQIDEVLVSPMSLREGYRVLPALGNAQHNTFFSLNVNLSDLAPQPFLIWNVQAVDKSFAGSPFSDAGFIYLAGQELAIEDIPNDEGGEVMLTWDASHLDVSGGTMAYYSVWRRILPEPDNIGSASLVTPADIPAEFEGAAIRRIVSDDGKPSYWEWSGNQPAMSIESYSFVAATTGNRISTDDKINEFMIVAHTNESAIYFDGMSSEGYSIDNMAPATPSDLIGVKDDRVVSVTWAANQEPDFKEYLVYKGETEDFDVTSRTPVAITTIPNYQDESSFAAGSVYYKVVAEDIHENRSEASGATEVFISISNEEEAGLPELFTLHQNYPNPFNPNTVIQFDMPAAAQARLAIYNAYGQQVALLIDQTMPAGQHVVSWQPEGLSSGTYFYRFETVDFVASKRMIFVK